MTAPVRHAQASARIRGRPREFDANEALDKAIRVFSERGYHGASIAHLTEAMNLAQGSLYKAFGDKQGIFLAAFQRYRALRTEKLRRAVGENGGGRERLRRALAFYVQSSQGDEGRLGCLVVGSAVELSTLEPAAARHVVNALERNEVFFGELIRQGQDDGSIAAHVDARAAARMMLCLVQGMRVVGKTGRSRKDLQAAVDAALGALS